MILRQWHTYLGVFIAPSVLFFALTGAYQVFDLHEPHGDYQPPPILQKLAQVHKKQTLVVRRRPAPRPGAGGPSRDAASRGPGGAPPPTGLGAALLKWFFALVSAGLAISTALGLWIGLSHVRRKVVAWSLLAAGTVLPLALLAVA